MSAPTLLRSSRILLALVLVAPLGRAISLDRARAEDSTNAQKGLFSAIDSVEVVDPSTVKVTLKQPQGAFLYNMVRIMVGTLVEVGLRRRTPESIAELLAQPDRRRAGPTAPPEGLTLVEVRWPPPNGLGAGDGAATAE